MSPLPVMTREQRSLALAAAARTRKERTEALGRVRTRAVSPAAALNDTASPVQGARVRQFLLAVPGIGPKKADEIMADFDIDPGRRVRGLGARQRERLAERLSA